MGIWTWFKQSQTPKKKKRRDDDPYMFAAPSPLMGPVDPFTGVLVVGANVVGAIAHGVRKRRQKKREARRLPEARVRR